MKTFRRLIFRFLILAGCALAALLLYGVARRHPEDLPWTALDLSQPVGAFTAGKLAALGGKVPVCLALLERAGIEHVVLPSRRGQEQCGYEAAVRLRARGPLEIGYRPEGLATSCPVAGGLALWEWHVVQPTALRILGSRVARIEHLGSYSCRRLYGRQEGAYSEHATANAVDISGFRLADGRRISVLQDWDDEGEKGAFLKDVRDGACDSFVTVLSPDYNRAHRDHLHLDQADRGTIGWGLCR